MSKRENPPRSQSSNGEISVKHSKKTTSSQSTGNHGKFADSSSSNIQINKHITSARSAVDIQTVIVRDVSNFNLINCATALHRLAKVVDENYQNPAVEKLCRQTVLLLTADVQNVNVRTLTSIAWAMGKLRQSSIAEPLARVCLGKLDQFDSQGVSNLLWGYAGASSKDLTFLNPLLKRALAVIHDFNAQELTNVAWACATLGLRDVPFMRALSSTVKRTIKSFQPQGLANIAWAFAKLNILDRILFGLLAHSAQSNVNSFGPQDVANMVWACARVNYTDTALFRALSTRANELAQDFSLQGLACALWGFAHSSTLNEDATNVEAVDVVFDADEKELNHVTENHVAETYHGTIQRLIVAVMEHKDALNGQQVMYVLAALAQLPQHMNPEHQKESTSRLAVQCIDLFQEMSAQDLAVTCWALTKLGCLNRKHRCLGKKERRRLVEAVLSRMTLLDAFNWRSCGHMELFLRTAENSKMDIPREHWEHLTKLAMVQINQINEESKSINRCPGHLFATMKPAPFAKLKSGSNVLLVGDIDNTVAQVLQSRGLHVAKWDTCVYTNKKSTLPSVWPLPMDEKYDACMVRYPNTTDAFKMISHAIGTVLKVNALVWVYGLVQDGVVSLSGPSSPIRPLFKDIQTIQVKDVTNATDGFASFRLPAVGCRVHIVSCRFAGAKNNVTIKSGIEDWATDCTVKLYGRVVPWRTYPGLFAQGTLDIMTETLLNMLPNPNGKTRVLDFACGSGIIAAALRIKSPDLRLFLLDNDAIALAAARVNVSDAREYVLVNGLSECTVLRDATKKKKLDWIVSNPPVHAGHPDDFSVVQDLIEGAPTFLKPGGSLFIVAQEQIPIGRIFAASGSDKYESVTPKYSAEMRFVVWHAVTVKEVKSTGSPKGKKRSLGEADSTIDLEEQDANKEGKKKKSKNQTVPDSRPFVGDKK